MSSLDDQILDLLERWEEAIRKGKPLSPEELAQGNSELAQRLKQAIESLEKANWMEGVADSGAKDSETVAYEYRGKKTAAMANKEPLGPYELIELLGQGGMGAVFKARHTRLDKFVAIKVLPENLTKNAEAVIRFEREMKAVGALEHPNIVRAMDANEQKGVHYLVMEYVDGKDLQRLLRERGPLSVPEACRIVRDAASALEHAHQHGLVHRDIKPSNLLVTTTGQLKVLDLGLAKLMGDTDSESGLTHTGSSLGTPDYMAPEQWNDSRTVDHRTDLYALGCTLYFLLVGRAPFATEQYRTVIGKMTAHAQGVIPSLLDERKEIPKELNQLYTELLAKSAEKRVQTAAELVERISPFCLASIPAVTVPRKIAEAPKSSSARSAIALRQKWVGLAAVLVFLAMGIGGSLYYSTRNRASTDGRPSGNAAASSQESTKGADASNRSVSENVKQLPPLNLIVPGGTGWLDAFPLIDIQRLSAPNDCWKLDKDRLAGRRERSVDPTGYSTLKLPLLSRSADVEVEMELTLVSEGALLFVVPANGGYTGVFFRTENYQHGNNVWLEKGKESRVRLRLKREKREVRAIVTVDDQKRLDQVLPLFENTLYDGKHYCLSLPDKSDVDVHSLRFKAIEGGLLVDQALPRNTQLPSFLRQQSLAGIIPAANPLKDGKRWQLYARWPNQPGAVDWSPDGKHWAVSDFSGVIRIYDAQTKQLTHLSASHEGLAGPLQWDKESKRVLSAGLYDQTAQVFSIDRPLDSKALPAYQNSITAVAWGPRAERLYASRYLPDGKLSMWDQDGTLLGVTQLTSPVADRALIYSEKWKKLYAILLDGKVVSVSDDLKQQKELPQFSGRGRIAIHPSETYLAFGRTSFDQNEDAVQIYSIKDDEIVARIPGKDIELAICDLAFSPDGQHLAVGTQSASLMVYDWKLGKKVAEYSSRYPTQYCRWDSSSSTLLCSAEYMPLKTWRPFEGKDVSDFGTGSLQVVLSPNGRDLAVHGNDQDFHVLEHRTGKLLKTISSNRGEMSPHRFSADGQRLYLGSYTIFGVPLTQNTNDVIREFKGFVHGEEMRSYIALSEDGNRLASIRWEGKTIRIWNMDGVCEHTIIDEHSPNRLALSPDGSRLATSYFRGTSTPLIRVIDAISGKKLLDIPGDNTERFQDLLWLANDRLIGLTSDGWAREWQLSGESSNELPKQPYVLLMLHNPSKPSEPLLVTKGDWGQPALRGLRSETSVLLQNYPGGDIPQTGVCSPDGKEITIVGQDEAIRTWNAATGELLRILVILPNQQFIILDPHGNVLEKSSDAMKELVCGVEEEDGSMSLHPPEEFLRVLDK